MYCILMEFQESVKRVSHWRNEKANQFTVFAQPYRDFKGKTIIPQWQKDLAQWVNRRQLFNSCEFKDFKPRKGFICNKYFKLYEEQ